MLDLPKYVVMTNPNDEKIAWKEYQDALEEGREEDYENVPQRPGRKKKVEPEWKAKACAFFTRKELAEEYVKKNIQGWENGLVIAELQCLCTPEVTLVSTPIVDPLSKTEVDSSYEESHVFSLSN
jgi:hypothetical protein